MSDRRRLGWWLAGLLAALLLVAPIWTVTVPALPDYPDHLARLALLSGRAGDPAQAFYTVHWQAVPNLAFDLVALPFAWLLPVEDAGRIFLTLTLLLWVAGPYLIHQALYGRPGLTPLLAAFFALNASFFWGFINFSFGAGLAFVALAIWIRSDTAGWAPRRRWLLLAGLAVAVYFCHLLALLTLAVGVVGYEAGCSLASAAAAGRRLPTPAERVRLVTRLIRLGTCFLPTAALFLLARPRGTGERQLVLTKHLAGLWRRWFAAIWTHFAQPDHKTLVGLVLLAAILLATRLATLDRRMRPVLLLLAILAALAPEIALGGWGAHLRFPAVLGALFFASLEIRVSSRRGQAGVVALAALALALFSHHGWALTAAWRGYDREVAELRAAFGALPLSTRLLVASNRISQNYDFRTYDHVGELAVIDRGAFVPQLYAIPGQQVIRRAPSVGPLGPASLLGYAPIETARLEQLAAGGPQPRGLGPFAYLNRWPCRFDHALVLGPDQGNPASAYLEPLARGSFFALFRIARPDGC